MSNIDLLTLKASGEKKREPSQNLEITFKSVEMTDAPVGANSLVRYSDLLANAFVKKPAKTATTADIANLASGAPNVVDGVSLSVNDRVLVWQQTTPSQNGIYVVSTVGTGANGVWVRATDFNEASEMIEGAQVVVLQGTTYADTLFVLQAAVPTVGTSAVTFQQTGGGSSEFSSALFRVYDDADPSAKVAFDLADISASQTRTIRVPDANVDLENLTDANVASNGLSGDSIRLANTEFLRARNAADNGDVNLIRAGGDDSVWIGSGTARIYMESTNLVDISAEQVQLYPFTSNAVDVRFWDGAGNESVGLKAPATLSTSYSLTLPVTGPTAGQTLSSDGSGQLIWTAPSSGAFLVRVAANSNVDVSSAPASIDGVTLDPADCILLFNQTLPEENGVWYFNGASAALTREVNWDSEGEFSPGRTVYVTAGDQYFEYVFTLKNQPAVLGTDPVVFSISGYSHLANNTALLSRNAAGTGNLPLIKADSSDGVIVGSDNAADTLTYVGIYTPDSSSGSTGAFDFYTGTVSGGTGSSGLVAFGTGTKTGGASGNTGDFIIETGNHSATTGDSGYLGLNTGNSVNGNSGFLNVYTGNAGGNSGNMTFTVGTAGGTRGYIKLDAHTIELVTEGDANATQNAGKIFGPAMEIRQFEDGNYANSGVSYGSRILFSGTDNSRDAAFQSGHVRGTATADSGVATFRSGEIRDTASGNTGQAILRSGRIQNASATGNTGGVLVESGNNVGTGNTGTATLRSGNATAGNSGDVSITTGTASGTRGAITASARAFSVNTAGGDVNIETTTNHGVNIGTGNVVGGSGPMYLYTGDATTSGDSGSMYLTVGLASGGTRGNIVMEAGQVDVGANIVPMVDSTYTVGSASNQYQSVYTNEIISSGALLLNTDTDGITMWMKNETLDFKSYNGSIAPTFKFWDNGSFSAGIKAPNTLAADYVLTLPVDDGAPGEVLSTDGSGVLSWVAGSTSEYSDATFRIQDNGDATKQLAFEVSGIATGTTRTITMPNADINLSTNTSGSFANRTLSNLGVTSINSDLLPQAANGVNIGSNILHFGDIRSRNMLTVDSGNNPKTLVAAGGTTSAASASNIGSKFEALFVSGVDSNMSVQTASSAASGSQASGSLYFETGNRSAGTASSGSIRLQTGTGTAVTGAINLLTGAGNAVNSGAIGIATGNANTGGQSGSVSISTGAANSGGGLTGSISVITGEATSGGGANTGTVTIRSGHSGNNTSGVVTISTGEGQATGHSGALNLSTGNGTGGSSNSGAINISTGTVSGGTRGNINLTAGAIAVNATITGNLAPTTDGGGSLGSTTKTWNQLWVNGISQQGSNVFNIDLQNLQLERSDGTPMLIWANTGYLDVNNNLISNVMDPQGLQDAATKNYVDLAVSAVSSSLNWRPSCIAATTDADLNSAADDTALSTLLPFSDDDSPQMVIGDFGDGQLLLSKQGATSKVFRIYDDAGTLRVTTDGVSALADGDAMTVLNDLPASPDNMEGIAIYAYNGSDIVRVASLNFNTADGIQINSPYSPSSGVINAGDSVQTAIEKLDGTKATVELNNLNNTAINVDLLPGVTNSIDLGSAALRFQGVHSNFVDVKGTNAYMYAEHDPSGSYVQMFPYNVAANVNAQINVENLVEAAGGPFGIITGGSNEHIQISTSAYSPSGGSSGDIYLASGNVTGASNNSGNVNLFTGTSGSGTRGQIELNARVIQLTADEDINLQGGGGTLGINTISTAGAVPIIMATNFGNATNDIDTGAITISTGDGLGAGNSGSINMSTGTVASGVQGDIAMSAGSIMFSAGGEHFGNIEMSSLKASWGDPIPALVLDGASAAAQAAYGTGIILDSDADKGDLLLFTKDMNSAVDSAGISMATGNQAGAGNSGYLDLYSGHATGAGNTGSVALRSGGAQAGNTGGVDIGSGQSASGGQTGAVVISSGGSPTGTSGDVLVMAGNAATQGVVRVGGKTVSLEAENNGVALIEISDLATTSWGADQPAIVLDGTSNAANSNGGVGIILKGSDTQDNWLNISTSDKASNIKTAPINVMTGYQTGTGDTGQIEMMTGASTGGNSGHFTIQTGQASTGTSGNLQLFVGAGNTQGVFKFLKSGVPSVVGQVWTASATDGTGYWATPTTGANQALSNLASVNLNENLTTTKSSELRVEHQAATFGVGMYTANNGSGNSGALTMQTGTASGNSGAITLETGTATANRGDINLNARNIVLGGLQNITYAAVAGQRNIGDPTRQVTGLYMRDNIYGFDSSNAQVYRIANNAGPSTPSGVATQFSISKNQGTTAGAFGLFGTSGATAEALYLETGNSAAADANATPLIQIKTGNKTAGTGNSGAINLQTGTSAGGTRGAITLNASSVDFTNAPVGSNLLPAANLTHTLGSSSFKWNQIHGASYRFDSMLGNLGRLSLTEASFAIPSGTTAHGHLGLSTQNQTLAIYTDSSASNGTTTSNVRIETGNATGTTANSGDIVMQTGTATGNRGDVMVDADKTTFKYAGNATVLATIGTVAGLTNDPMAWGADVAGLILDGSTAEADASGGVGITMVSDAAGANSLALLTSQKTNATKSSDITLFTGANTSSGNTGQVYIAAGNASSGNTGGVTVYGGNSITGASGDISLTIGTAGTTQGEFKFLKEGVASVVGQVWTATGTGGEGYWDDVPAATAAGSAGSIQFNDGSNGFAADAANLHWDDTNNQLAIGANTFVGSEKLNIVRSGNGEVVSFGNGTQTGQLYVDGTNVSIGSQTNHNFQVYANDGSGAFFTLFADASAIEVHNTAQFRPQTDLGSNLGDATHLWQSVYAERLRSSDDQDIIHLQNRTLLDSSSTDSVQWDGRVLVDSAGGQAASWANRTLIDSNNGVSSDWENRTAIDDNNQVTIDWQNNFLRDPDTTTTSLHWENRHLIDSGSGLVLNWDTRRLYADDGSTINLEWSTAGVVSVNNALISNVAAPVSAGDAANKAYVDAVASGLSLEMACRVATTAALVTTYANGSAGVGATLTANSNGAISIDGVSLSVNDRVLVKNQSNAFENGIYYVSDAGSVSTPYVLTRATDFDQVAEIQDGSFVFVQQGTVNADHGYVQINAVATMGTDAITWTQFSAAGSFIAGNGLVQTGNTLDIDLATNSGLFFDSTQLSIQNADTSLAKSGSGIYVNVFQNGGIETTANGLALNARLNGQNNSGSTIAANNVAMILVGQSASNGSVSIKVASPVAGDINQSSRFVIVNSAINNAATGSTYSIERPTNISIAKDAVAVTSGDPLYLSRSNPGQVTNTLTGFVAGDDVVQIGVATASALSGAATVAAYINPVYLYEF